MKVVIYLNNNEVTNNFPIIYTSSETARMLALQDSSGNLNIYLAAGIEPSRIASQSHSYATEVVERAQGKHSITNHINILRVMFIFVGCSYYFRVNIPTTTYASLVHHCNFIISQAPD